MCFLNRLFLALVAFLILGCSSGGSGSNDNDTKPTNLVINTEIVGSNTSNPNGNGSGLVNFTVSANNATSYRILIGTDVINTTTGVFNYTFTQSGTNNYTIYVSAYNGAEFISSSVTITVFVTTTMAWSDEFNTDGPPDSSKWSYDLGAGGWGNNELQYYTNRPENVIVQGGVLKINLIKEPFNGSNYTSARILTKNKYEFKYGRVDIRAKLPAGGGTWPALWMLGSDINTNPWPACGEIDIMEHIGNNLNRIYGTLHHPGHSGGNADGGNVLINNATTEFHIYSCEWSASTIKFYVDNVLFYTFNNNSGLPFNKPFFFIFNCAMGGNFGGAVDPNFTSATLEVDYVHVYH
ncbi:glycoside hydrolase family 16 protein [Flavobacterium sp. J49]|nr:glycoside hydrolase family 16 protein [Flavobacterium sp. J49]NIC01415.1 glycoside hydrolase family 16 protein [Flavobacterium sp. J49]